MSGRREGLAGGLRARLYRKVTRTFPSLWRPMRRLLFGRTDLNAAGFWEDSYDALSTEERQALVNRVPNLVSVIVDAAEPYDEVLEVSAGYGNLVTRLRRPGRRIVATEGSSNAVHHLEGLGFEAHHALLPELPFPDASFDVVVSVSVFEHLPDIETVRDSFAACHRVCREGFLFSVPHDCMPPWEALEHNFLFRYEDVVELTRDLFEVESARVVPDGVTQRWLFFLRKRPPGPAA